MKEKSLRQHVTCKYMSSKTGIGKKGRTIIFLERGGGGYEKISSANFFLDMHLCKHFFSQKDGSLFAAVNHYLI